MGPMAAMHSLLEEAPPPPADAAGSSGELAPPEAILNLIELQGAVDEGRMDYALNLIEETVASRAISVFVVDMVADPFFDPIRNEPRYREILGEVGLAEYWPVEAATAGN